MNELFPKTTAKAKQIEEAHGHVAEIDARVAAAEECLGDSMAGAVPDTKAADQAARSIEELNRERKLLVVRISRLEEQIQRDQEEDMQTLARTIGTDLRAAMKASDEARRRYIKAIDALNDAIDAVGARNTAVQTVIAQARLLERFGIVVDVPSPGAEFDAQLCASVADNARRVEAYRTRKIHGRSRSNASSKSEGRQAASRT